MDRNQSRGNVSPKKQNKPKCFVCGKLGHLDSKCAPFVAAVVLLRPADIYHLLLVIFVCWS